MTEDITTNMMAGGTFSGTLDGDGNIVTLTLGSESNYLLQSCSMFGQLSGATIKNLRIAGSIYSSAQFNASMARFATGTNTIQGCVSSVSIHSNITGDCTNGGFIGFINTIGSSLVFEGCAFTGEMIGANATNWGGFIGWRDNQCSATFTDCLFAPTKITLNTINDDSRTFCRSNSTDRVSFTNCYYTTALQKAEGGVKALTTTRKPENIGSETKVYGVQKQYEFGILYGVLKAYENGIYYEGKYYAGYKPQGDGTAKSPYLIKNNDEWQYIRDCCNNGNTYSGKYLKLTANLTVDFVIDGAFSGTLDGDSHTIKLVMGNNAGYINHPCAIFNLLNGATVKNLRIEGDIYSSTQNNASLACKAIGNCLIENCVSTVRIDGRIRADDCSNGGFIGIMYDNNSSVSFKGCAFVGRMVGGQATNWGGFIGWRESGSTVTFTDCLFKPAEIYINISAAGSNSRTFCRSNNTSGATYTNCYYTYVLQEADGGAEAFPTTSPDVIGSVTKDYGMLQAHTNGLSYEGIFYYHHNKPQGEGTADSPYLISNIDDWRYVRDCCNSGNTFDGKFLKLTTDLTVDFIVSSTFRGTFDGDGHTMTLAFGSADNYLDQPCALFNKIEGDYDGFGVYGVQGATIKNLRIAGSIYSSAQNNASIAREAAGTSHLRNCVSTVSINSNKDGDCTNGGFIGHMGSSGSFVYFDGCAFLGEMKGANAIGWGGFIGWRAWNINQDNFDGCFAKFTDCLFAPTTVNVNTSTGNSRTFSRSSSNTLEGVGYTRCYYTTVLQAVDGGWEALTATKKPADIGSKTTNYGLLQAYENGLYYDGKYYHIPIPQGEGTADSPYLIGNKYEWQYIGKSCQAGNNYGGKHLKLTADFTVCFSVGGTDHYYRDYGTFSGTLDGDGHTITLAFGSESGYLHRSCALFHLIDNATIKNLRIAGSIYSLEQNNASIARKADGTNYFRNCVSTVSIHSNKNGEGTNGGFIARIINGESSVNFAGCAFLGEMIGPNTYNWGGFVGWREYIGGDLCTATFTDCLFAPTQLNVKTNKGSCRTFCRSRNNTNGATYTGCYYTTVLQEADGGVRALSATSKPAGIGSMTTDYGLLQAYAKGLYYDGKYYSVYVPQGEGTEASPYLINSIDDWRYIRDLCIYGNTLEGKFLKLTGDFTADCVVGGTFSGTLDGNGHTITLALGSTDNYLDQSCALFNQLNGATIKNLRMAGSIYSSAQNNASIARRADGNNHIQNSVSTVSIHSNREGDGTNGGFIGMINTNGSIVNFAGCAFLGEMIGPDATNWGGFVGWREYEDENNCYANFTDCLFAPTQLNVNAMIGDSRTFSRSRNNSTDGATYTGCYYTTVLQEVDGGVRALTSTTKPADIGSMTTDYGLLQAYSNGISYDGKYYSVYVLQGEGTEASPYLISNTTDWHYIRDNCNRGNTLEGKFLKLTADLTVDFVVDGTFSGTLDGNGHTFTLALGSTNNYHNQSCALFNQLNGATINNLRMAGSIFSSAMHNASIACEATGGNNHVRNCVSTVSIHSNITGDCTNGGFIGAINTSGSTVDFEGCAFLGEMIGQNATCWGGFIGWRDYSNYQCSATFTDCLFAPTQLNVKTSTDNSRTFCRSSSNTLNGAGYTRCYYTTALQTVDGGWEALTATKKPADIGSKTTNYGLLQAYENGLYYDGKYYHIPIPQGEGTADSPYLIGNKYEWQYIGKSCQAGNNYSGKHLKLTANLTVDFVVGGTFSGTLDGNGHTFTLALGSKSDYLDQSCALFNVIKGATIKNLRMAGSIYSSAQNNASIARRANGGNSLVRNCVSTVSIHSNREGDGSNGGFIGLINTNGCIVNFAGCAFLGEMISTDTNNWGGFVGWREYKDGNHCYANFTDCLFSPTHLDVISFIGNSRTFSRSRNNSTDGATYTGCYYTTILKAADGGHEAISSTTLPDDIGTEAANYGFIQAYTNGLKCGDLYYVNTDNIELADNADNYALICSNLDKTKNVTLQGRTLYKDGKWNTLCLPFDVTIAGSPLDGDGVQVRELNSAESNIRDGVLKLTFNKVSDGVLKAATPYFIKWTEGDNLVSPVFNNVTITAEYANASLFVGGVLLGSFSPSAIDESNIGNVLMLTDDNKLAYSTVPRMLRSCRAHIFIYGIKGSYAVKQATIDFGDGETTGIEIIDNGQLIIDNSSNEQWYDLNGRKLQGKPTQKGIYIVNGHQVVIK